MASLTDVYEERSRESGLEVLYTELQSRLNHEPSDRRRLGSSSASNHSRLGTSWTRWLWFSSPAARHYGAGALLLFGIVLDTVTTGVLLGSGTAIEGNNLLRPVYRTTGVVGLAGVKAAVVAIGVTLFRIVGSRRWAEWMMAWFYAACGTGWTIAGAWNLLVGVFVFGV